jgi:hybrid cluster-associated redox disulfide protein
MSKIIRSSTIGNVLREHPEAIPILMEAGIGCVGCPRAQMETIEEGLKMHGLSDSQIDQIISAMNSASDKTKK